VKDMREPNCVYRPNGSEKGFFALPSYFIDASGISLGAHLSAFIGAINHGLDHAGVQKTRSRLRHGPFPSTSNSIFDQEPDRPASCREVVRISAM
jgi:hypothetical protein